MNNGSDEMIDQEKHLYPSSIRLLGIVLFEGISKLVLAMVVVAMAGEYRAKGLG